MTNPSVVRSTMLTWLFVTFICFLSCATNALAGTYYVATNGNDNNPGTINQPFATFNQAISVVGNTAGSIIYGRQGTYYQTGADAIFFSNNGTAEKHIIIEAYPGEKVIIDGSALNQYVATVQLSGKYIELNHITVVNSAFTGILCWDCNYAWIHGNTIYNSQASAIAVGDDATLTGTTNVIVSDNIAYNNSLSNQSRTASGWSATLTTQGASKVSFSHNTVYDNYGEGIDFCLSNDSSAVNNTVYDNYSVEIYLDNATNATVNANLIYNTGNTEYWLPAALGDCVYESDTPPFCPSSSIQIANESDDAFKNVGHHRTVTNNIAIGGNQNFNYGDYGYGGGLVDDVIANNVFYAPFAGGGGENLYIAWTRKHRNTTIANNIFDSNGVTATYIYEAPSKLPMCTLTFETNLWYGGRPQSQASGKGDVLASPDFVNVSSYPWGFELRKGSPAIGAGTTLPAVPDNFNGAPRKDAYNIGAF